MLLRLTRVFAKGSHPEPIEQAVLINPDQIAFASPKEGVGTIIHFAVAREFYLQSIDVRESIETIYDMANSTASDIAGIREGVQSLRWAAGG